MIRRVAGAVVLLAALALAGSVVSAARRNTDTPPGSTAPIEITLHALADSVPSHQTTWIEVRITNRTSGGLDVPWRGERIPGEWRFEDAKSHVKYDWPKKEETEKSPVLRLGPGETMYEVVSPESGFGVLTEPGTIRATCRVKGELSKPIELTRRGSGASDPPSILRDAGPLLGAHARETIQVKLWSACATGGDNWFDCDEALYTVAWDRMQGMPVEAMAVVDTLIARHPESGWCRPAIHDCLERLPEATGRRWIDAIIARAPGGVAEAYAREMHRRDGFGQFPAKR